MWGNAKHNRTDEGQDAWVVDDSLMPAFIIIVLCAVIFFTVLYLWWFNGLVKLMVLRAVLRMFCASCYQSGRKLSTRASDSLRRDTSENQPSEVSAYIASSQFEEMSAARRLQPEMHSAGLTTSRQMLSASLQRGQARSHGA